MLHAINLDSDAIAQELMQRLFGISTWSDVDHNGLADTTSENEMGHGFTFLGDEIHYRLRS